MTKEERLAIKIIVEEALKNKMGSLSIERQQHFKDHEKVQAIAYDDITFLNSARKLVGMIEASFWKTFVRVIVFASFSVLTGGVYAYIKYGHYKGH